MQVLQWECPVLRQLWKRSCATCLVICCRRELSPKIADNLYCGGNTPQELFENWKKVLQALYKCNLRLSASKTVINPKSTTILGWIWSAGTLTASPTPCQHPGLLSRTRYCRAYEILCRCIQGPLSCDSTVFSISRPPSMKQQPDVNPKNLSLGLMSYVAHFAKHSTL